MARRLIPDDVWQQVELLMLPRRRHPKGGRPHVGDRETLTGVLFVLKTGIAWEDLPSEMGCGCGMTCLRRLREWQANGIWGRIQPVLERRLEYADRVDWKRAAEAAMKPQSAWPARAERGVRERVHAGAL